MAGTLRETVKRLLGESKLTYTTISRESGVPYGALYHFATKGDDMKSCHMEKLYTYLTGEPLLDSGDEG
jgi:predicted transcriptional regulator